MWLSDALWRYVFGVIFVLKLHAHIATDENWAQCYVCHDTKMLSTSLSLRQKYTLVTYGTQYGTINSLKRYDAHVAPLFIFKSLHILPIMALT